MPPCTPALDYIFINSLLGGKSIFTEQNRAYIRQARATAEDALTPIGRKRCESFFYTYKRLAYCP